MTRRPLVDPILPSSCGKGAPGVHITSVANANIGTSGRLFFFFFFALDAACRKHTVKIFGWEY